MNNIQSYSGLSFGKTENQIVQYNADTGERPQVLTIYGRYFYVKKCVRPSKVGNIAIPEKTQKDTTACLVLAIGLGCGKYYDLTEDDKAINRAMFEKRGDHLLDMVECVPLNIRVNDRVFAPDIDPYGSEKGISRITNTEDEYLIHECLVIGACDEDEE